MTSQENEPLVSIGMPVYNGGKTLETAIRSIINQTYTNWELIIIDDGSSDDSIVISKSFDDPRIKVLHDGENRDLPMRLNEAVFCGQGQYFARMDQDDISYPERIEKQLNYLLENPNVDLVGSQVVVFKGDGVSFGKRACPERHEEICAKPYTGFPVVHPSYLGRMDWFRDNIYRPEAVKCEDQDLLLRTYTQSRFANVQEILLGYREDKLKLSKMLTARRHLVVSFWSVFCQQGRPSMAVLATLWQILKGFLDILAVSTGFNYTILKHRAKKISEAERDNFSSLWRVLSKSQPLCLESTKNYTIPPVFLNNISWSLVGNVFYAISQWGLLVALAKLGSTKMVGQFTLGLAVTAPVIMLTNLQLRNVLSTDAKGDYEFSDYFGLRLITTLIAYAIIVIVVIAAGYDKEVAEVVLAVGLTKSIESIGDVFYGGFQHHRKFDFVAISKIIKGGLSLTAIIVVIYLTNSVVLGCLAMAAGWGLVLLSYDIPTCNRLTVASNQNSADVNSRALATPQWKMSTLRNLVWLTLPLGFVEMLASFNINTPRYFIESKIGLSELGIYSAMAYVMVAGGTVVYSMGQAAMPQLAKLFHDNNKAAFKHLLARLTAVGLLLGFSGIAVAVFFGEPLLTIIYQKEYAAHNEVFIVIMIASALNYIATFLWVGIISARKFRVQIVLFGGALCVNLLACSILVPAYGMLGGALAFVLAELFRGGAGLVITYRILKLDFSA